MHVLYRARWSFVGQTRSFLDTGRLMARWSEQALELLAPTLEWTSTVEQHSDYELVESWESSHVVRYRAAERGEGCSELIAGGRGKKVGGSGRVTLTSLGPFAFFEADGHCDVEHWDIVAGGVSEAAIDGVRLLLEAEIGAKAKVTVTEIEPFARGAVVVVTTEDEAEAILWAGDLDDAGLIARSAREGPGWTVRIEASEIGSLKELDEARVTLGEVLAEAGHEDWASRAEAILARLPDRADHSS